MIVSARAYAAGAPSGRKITDFSPLSPQWTLLYAAAIELARLWLALRRSYYSLFCVTASGTELELRARDYGITKLGAGPASVTIRATLDSGGTYPATIVLGSTAGADTGVVFATLADAVVGSYPGVGYVDIAAQAQTSGAFGNVRQRTVTTKVGSWNAVVLSVTNPAAASGGTDEETDTQLRSRTVARWALGAVGMQESYLAWLQEANSEVLRCLVTQGDTLGATTATLVRRSGATFSGGELTAMLAVIAPTETANRRVSLHETPTLANVTYTTITISALTVQIESGYNSSTVMAAIEDALNEYLDWTTWAWGGTVYRAQIIAVIASVDGVLSVDTTSLLINASATADVTVGATSLPKLGTVTQATTYVLAW